jgi:predicted methyltransferase
MPRILSQILAAAVAAFACGLAGAHGGSAASSSAVAESAPLPPDQISQEIKDALAAADRPAADKALDAGRRPEQMLAFFGIRPGMKVADLFAGGGYTTELLSRVVGPTGTVYSQEPVFPPESQQIEQAWSTRLAQPTFKNVIAVHQSFGSDDLLPAKPGSLDAIIVNMNYHDLVLLGVDRDKLNAEMFRALKPGGVYGIIDHSAKNGSGLKDISLHRIDEGLLIDEVEKAGFRLAAASSALRHPEDDRTWVTAPRAAGERRGTSDRFMLKFVKS